MKLSIIIINFNNVNDTKKCLLSLEKADKSNLELATIIVNNTSNRKNLSSLKKEFPKKIFIDNKNNIGFAQGNNVGIQQALTAKSDYVLLLNNDTLVDKKFLLQLVEAINNDDKIGIVCPKIYFASGFEFHKNRYQKNQLGRVLWYAGGLIDWQNILPSHRGVDKVDTGQYDKAVETAFATGCCMLVKKQVFEKIGFFDNKYFLYWEDIDFCQRAKKADFKILYTPSSVIWHKNASSSGGAGSHLAVYYQTRNRLLFAFKYAKLKNKLSLVKEAIKTLIIGSQWEKKAVRDFLLLKFGPLQDE